MGRVEPDCWTPGAAVCPLCDQNRNALRVVYAAERARRPRLLILCVRCYNEERRQRRKWVVWELLLKLQARGPRDARGGTKKARSSDRQAPTPNALTSHPPAKVPVLAQTR